MAEQETILLLAGSVEILAAAADGANRGRLTAVVYSGGILRLPIGLAGGSAGGRGCSFDLIVSPAQRPAPNPAARARSS